MQLIFFNSFLSAMCKIKKTTFKIYHYVQVCLLRIFSICFSKKMDISHLSNKVLVISPHPDDEVFGCGGLMQTLVRSGRHVEVIILSQGEAVHRHCCPDDEMHIIDSRGKLTDKANAVIGLSTNHIYRMGFPDGDFNSAKDDNDIISALSNLIKKIAPTDVFIPHAYENSPDHVAATEILERILNDLSINTYYYCVWTWYHMPIYKILKLKYKNARLLRVENSESKNKAIDIYINNSAKCGVSYSGDLPKPFIYAFRWKYELFFEA